MNHTFLQNPELDLESVTIESPRCILEPFRMEWIEFDDLQKAFVEANEKFYVSPNHPTVEEEKEFIEWAISNRRSGKAFECYILDKNSGNLIGCMGITSLDTPEPNLGLWIRKEFHGKWYWTEVYTSFLDWAKQTTNFTFFKHAVNPENTASIRLAEHFQGKLQGVLTERGELKYYISL